MTSRAPATKRPLIRSARLWVPVGIVVVIVGLGIVGMLLANRAFAAKDALEAAIPLAEQTQQQLAAGDNEGAKATAQQVTEYAAEARKQTDDPLWRSLEWVPVAGPNLQAVRVASASVDELVSDAVLPATEVSVEALKPQGGAIDVAAVEQLAQTVGTAASSVRNVAAELERLDRPALIGPVADGIAKLDRVVAELTPTLDAADKTLKLLPAALGADGPRNYLMLFQNNAESRGTGGNPAAIVMVNVTDGVISIAQQASSADFANNRPEPIVAIDPETEALYGDKIGRFMQDITLTPDFTESAEIMRAWWAETFGTQVDGVVSFDPVGLSYLLGATGPVTLPTGETLTSENAVSQLLNEVYFRYEAEEQDAFFAGAAATVFEVLRSGSGDMSALVESLGRAIDEGRLMYVPSDAAEAEYIADTRVSGTLPVDNTGQTIVGVYVDDITEGKLDYYAKLAVDATSDQCTADAPTFTTTATFASTLDPAAVEDLAEYISPARFFEKGWISTDLVLYGPVGSTFSSATVDGAPAEATALPHLGRPAVKVNILNGPGESHTVAATFTGAAGEYGPLEVWHTPMVQPTDVTVSMPGC
ncbi:DUF4012 domain-containing protein [Agromyces sp. Marseille-P2726]|uniref:DUF4012 domain-containing protein n=1 Tax=Agromyces sp. Marseille-P2726 TaxID=2709132 RepID=UPI0015709B86|nr:DUF4012 domain-containing protein [Agromyces sp. Marseille-P2726]